MSDQNMTDATSTPSTAPGQNTASQPPRAGHKRPADWHPSARPVSRSKSMEPEEAPAAQAASGGPTQAVGGDRLAPISEQPVQVCRFSPDVQPAARFNSTMPTCVSDALFPLLQGGVPGSGGPASSNVPDVANGLQQALGVFVEVGKFLETRHPDVVNLGRNPQSSAAFEAFSNSLRNVVAHWHAIVTALNLDVVTLAPVHLGEFHSLLAAERARTAALQHELSSLRKRYDDMVSQYPPPQLLIQEVSTFKNTIKALTSSVKTIVDASSYARVAANAVNRSVPADATHDAPPRFTPQKRSAAQADGLSSAATIGGGPAAKRLASEHLKPAVDIPSATNWDDIARAASVGRVVNSLTYDQAIAIANTFGVNPAPTPVAGHLPAASAKGSKLPPVKAQLLPASTLPLPPKPKPPVPHLQPPKDASKSLIASFSRAVAEASRRTFDDINQWVSQTVANTLTPAESESIRLEGIHWDPKGVSVTLRFAVRPPVALQRALNDRAKWLANVEPDVPIEANVVFYTPITLIALNAVQFLDDSGREISMEEIYKKIIQENPKVAAYLVPHIQQPRPFWAVRAPGSGTLVIAIFDDKKGVHAKAITKHPVMIDKVAHFARVFTPPKINAFCTRCFRWNHTAAICGAAVQFCAKCGGAHLSTLHNRLGLCCAEERQQRKVEVIECPPEHDFCPNCGNFGHRATSHGCVYYRNRFSREWLKANPPKHPGPVVRKSNTYKGYKPKAAGHGNGTAAHAGSEQDVNMGATHTDAEDSEVEQVSTWEGASDAEDQAVAAGLGTAMNTEA